MARSDMRCSTGWCVGSVLAHSHRIVRPDVDHRQCRERRQPHRRAACSRRNRRTWRQRCGTRRGRRFRSPRRPSRARGRRSGGCGHSPRRRTGSRGPFERGLGGTREVRVAAEELRDPRRQGVHGLAGRVPGGEPVLGAEGRKPLVPPLRQPVPEAALQFGSPFRRLRASLVEDLPYQAFRAPPLPVAPRSAHNAPGPPPERRKGRLRVEPESRLGGRRLVGTQRSPVGGRGARLGRRPVPDGRVHHDERRLLPSRPPRPRSPRRFPPRSWFPSATV